jgi:transposase
MPHSLEEIERRQKHMEKEVEKWLFVGIDVGKRKHDACFLEGNGKVLKYMQFDNRIESFKRFLSNIEQFSKEGFKVSVTVEATGHYFLNLYSFLTKRGIEVTVVNPIQTDSVRNVFIRKTKSDRRDSFIIAELARLGRARKSNIDGERSRISNIKMLTRFRMEYVSKVSNIKKKLSSLVDRVFPEFFDVFKGFNTRTSLMILRNYPTPRRLLREDRTILYALVKSWSKGRMEEEVVDRLISLAKDSIGSFIDIDAIEVEIPFIVDEIFFLEEKVKEIERHIEEQSSEIEEIELLKTIPGISTVSAASIVGEIANIDRFDSAKKLRAYAGIDPSLKESGDSVRGRSTISKRGSPYLRRTLYYAANVSRRFSPTFKEYYKRKLSQHPNRERYAIVSVANKLITVIYYILKSKKPFDPFYEMKIKGIQPEITTAN